MKRLKGSLVWKLTIWFLLLSFLPLAVLAIFTRHTVSETFFELASDDTLSQVKLLANEVSSSTDDRELQTLLARFVKEDQYAFLVSEGGNYLAHSDGSKAGGSVGDDFSAQVAAELAAGGERVVTESATGRLVGFSPVPGAFSTAVLIVDGAVVSTPMGRIQRAAAVQLAVSLVLVAVAGGTVIWFVFKPVQKLTKAAEELGAGNLDVQIDPSEMEGELEVLALAFNQMTRQIQVAHDELEQRVEARTEELRESEERYRTLFEDSRDAIFVGSHGKIIAANEATLETFGLTKEEVIGSDVGDRFVDQADRDRFRQEIDAVGYVSDFEVKLRKKDGQVMDCLLTATSRPAANSDSAGDIQGIIRDITERKRAEDTLLQQTRELAVLEERNRMAQEIHDTLAQGFTGIFLQLEAGEQALTESPDEVLDHLSKAKSLARESLQEARRSVWGLLPHALEQLELVDALQEEVDKFATAGGEQAVFKVVGDIRELMPAVQTAILRICQESLTNVQRHAEANQVHVTLTFQHKAVHLAVQDDGQGFEMGDVEPESAGGGFGLTGMGQRAKQLEGTLAVKSAKSKGTLVEVTIPTL